MPSPAVAVLADDSVDVSKEDANKGDADDKDVDKKLKQSERNKN